ncbi:MAG TPA: cyclase family protein [Gaiellaceae bacterium]
MTGLAEAIRRARVYDVSPVLDNDTPVFPGHPEPLIEACRTHEADGYFAQALRVGEHTGSHVDAPAHALAGRADATIDTYDARRFVAPYGLVDLTDRRLGPGELASAADIEAALHRDRVALEPGDAALLCFGWDVHRPRGAWWAANTPGLDESACAWLLDRGVTLVGSDTPTADTAVVDGRIVAEHGHLRYFLPNDVLLVEGLVGLGAVPRNGVLVAAPLKIAGGSGAPARVLILADDAT